ncbi:MAG: M3 family metallopeptidase [Burkholderiales bacterium]|nr:M3 family metallopeptidase [Burkholderiales bacterium]
MQANDNPLLDFSGLPRFDAIRPEHVTPAIDALLADARATVEHVATADGAPTWDTLVEPLEESLDHLDRAWSTVRHLNAVISTPALRDTHNENLGKIVDFHTGLAQDLRLYAKYRALREQPAFASLSAAQRRLIDNELRDFKLGGAELADADKARFRALQEELADLSTRFDDHVLDATNAWAHYCDDERELAGVPGDVVMAAREAAEAEGRAGYKLTLRMPCYLPVLRYARNRDLRRRLHEASSTRASDLGAKIEWDNGPLIARILELRRESAKLLGYANYAQVSLVPKMVDHPDEVVAFLRDFARRARPFAERDYAELVRFARTELDLAELAPCDVAFASELLKARRYAFDEQELRQYFPEDAVLAGLFRVVETIYGVRITAAQAPVWHPTVRFFAIHDGNGVPVGSFYFDLYAREGKQGGAWMDDAINRRRTRDTLQRPVAYLTCNLSAPVGERPATFTHDEVITIFHEFGHGLHLLLTQVDVAGVSGIQGVEWDAVELPSQFMENFCWEWDVLRHMTRHVDSGAPLPREFFDRMLAAKNFQIGMGTVRQLEMGLFDMLLHDQFDGTQDTPWPTPQALLDAVRREVAVVPRAPYDRFMHAFGHVFAGGYAAGYYSYQWAEVLSADAYGMFEEEGVLSPAAGARFRDEILARGGSRPALESFVAFRGRPPQLDALLRHNGMVASS